MSVEYDRSPAITQPYASPSPAVLHLSYLVTSTAQATLLATLSPRAAKTACERFLATILEMNGQGNWYLQLKDNILKGR